MVSLANYNDYHRLIEVWEQSVKATHHFLPNDYFVEIKALLPAIFPQLPIYAWKDNNNIIQAFAGVSEHKIEMLFVDPACMGKGIGKQLLNFCVIELKANKVDVNEQNEQAVGFYKKMGFKAYNRQELDGMGRPFPLLLMKYTA